MRPRRPTEIAVGSLGTLSVAYDRGGNVVEETRDLPAAMGVPDAGPTDQTFTYDGLDRMIGATLGSATDFEYDLDSNRTKVGAASYSFNRADQLETGPSGSFSDDRYGNLVTSAETSPATAYGYDALDRLTSINPDGTASDVAFTLDALGRPLTRTVGTGPGTTYGYAKRSADDDG